MVNDIVNVISSAMKLTTDLQFRLQCGRQSNIFQQHRRCMALTMWEQMTQVWPTICCKSTFILLPQLRVVTESPTYQVGNDIFLTLHR